MCWFPKHDFFSVVDTCVCCIIFSLVFAETVFFLVWLCQLKSLILNQELCLPCSENFVEFAAIIYIYIVIHFCAKSWATNQIKLSISRRHYLKVKWVVKIACNPSFETYFKPFIRIGLHIDVCSVWGCVWFYWFLAPNKYTGHGAENLQGYPPTENTISI